jgi:hypothetical protein
LYVHNITPNARRLRLHDGVVVLERILQQDSFCYRRINSGVKERGLKEKQG